MTMSVQIPLQDLAFRSLGYMPSSRRAGSEGSLIFNCFIVDHSSFCTLFIILSTGGWRE